MLEVHGRVVANRRIPECFKLKASHTKKGLRRPYSRMPREYRWLGCVTRRTAASLPSSCLLIVGDQSLSAQSRPSTRSSRETTKRKNRPASHAQVTLIVHEIVVLEQLVEEHVTVGAENKLVAVADKPVDRVSELPQAAEPACHARLNCQRPLAHP